MNKTGFTLAEVLITLGVIGVVAAITLLSFMENVTERINSERQANIAQKITQAMEQMRAHGLLNTQYQSTDAFVDELQKYLKIAKRCDSNHIADCWPTEKVTMSDGEELEVSKAKTGANLSLSTETNNVGLILSDGASIILNYNPSIDPIDVGDKVVSVPDEGKSLPVGNGKSKLFPYTTTVTNAIDFVMDVNGGKKPNSEVAGRARDIRSFKTAQFSKADPCSKYPNSTYIEDIGCVTNMKMYKNQFEARAICSENGMILPTKNQLMTIANKKAYLYIEDCYSGRCWSDTVYYTSNYYLVSIRTGGIYNDRQQNPSYGFLCVGN